MKLKLKDKELPPAQLRLTLPDNLKASLNEYLVCLRDTSQREAELKEVARGELVLVCLPETLARFALARGYLARGAGCGDGIEPVGKRIGALAGDMVSLAPDYVAVNGKRLPNSAGRRRDSRGRPVPHVALGNYRVGEGEVWLFGEADPRSWDSRYFGPLAISDVRAELQPVITW